MQANNYTFNIINFEFNISNTTKKMSASMQAAGYVK